MMVDRRQGSAPVRPFCMSMLFMSGMIVGCIIHSNDVGIQCGLSIVVATMVFHFTYARDVSLVRWIRKVFKKGF